MKQLTNQSINQSCHWIAYMSKLRTTLYVGYNFDGCEKHH